jgi:hypothetical protein
MRRRRDVLADYKAIVQRIYRPAAYYGRVRCSSAIAGPSGVGPQPKLGPFVSSLGWY